MYNFSTVQETPSLQRQEYLILSAGMWPSLSDKSRSPAYVSSAYSPSREMSSRAFHKTPEMTAGHTPPSYVLL